MAKTQPVTAEDLKARGLSCSKLKSLEERQLKDANEFRKVGFNNIARAEEESAKKIKELRRRVCLLK